MLHLQEDDIRPRIPLKFFFYCQKKKSVTIFLGIFSVKLSLSRFFSSEFFVCRASKPINYYLSLPSEIEMLISIFLSATHLFTAKIFLSEPDWIPVCLAALFNPLDLNMYCPSLQHLCTNLLPALPTPASRFSSFIKVSFYLFVSVTLFANYV